MITSERQLTAAKSKLKELNKTIASMEAKPKASTLAKSSTIQIKTLIQQISSEINEYEELAEIGLDAIKIKSIDEIMLLPIKYRIAKHLSREDFSKIVDIPVRMIARYESGEYVNINGETFKKILRKIPIEFKGLLKEIKIAG